MRQSSCLGKIGKMVQVAMALNFPALNMKSLDAMRLLRNDGEFYGDDSKDTRHQDLTGAAAMDMNYADHTNVEPCMQGVR